MRPVHVQFAGSWPTFTAGQPVWCTNAAHEEVPLTAAGPARYDDATALGGRCFLTVPVAVTAEWRRHGTRARTINWPAEAVRSATPR